MLASWSDSNVAQGLRHQLMAPLGIVGPMGSGKDFVVAGLRHGLAALGIATESWAYGETFYRTAAQLAGIPEADLRAQKAAYLTLLQTVGNTPLYQRRAVSEMTVRLGRRSPGMLPIIILRRPSEARIIEKFGGALLFLHAPEAVRVDRIIKRDGVAPTRAQLTAPSEPLIAHYPTAMVLPTGLGATVPGVRLNSGRLTINNALREVTLPLSIGSEPRLRSVR